MNGMFWLYFIGYKTAEKLVIEDRNDRMKI